LALYFNQDLITAGRLPLSEVTALFESTSYQNWKKAQENRNKGMSAIIGGINNVIKGLNMLGKVFSRRSGGRR
jgi:hypothetical protein